MGQQRACLVDARVFPLRPTGRRRVPKPPAAGSRNTPPTRSARVQSSASTSSAVSDFARSIHTEDDPQQRLQRGVELVVDLVDGCDHAGVTIAEHNRLSTPAASDDVVRRGDTLQYELGEGPCLDSIRLEHTVISADLAEEARWPRWSV